MAHIPGHIGPPIGPLPGSPGKRFNWGSLASSAFSLAGGLYGGYLQRKESSKNRRFQQEMSSTAYQRAAADLEKAGLNRILALGGPATTPSGNMAAQQDPLTPGIHTAISARLATATIARINADTKFTIAKTNAIAPAAGVGGAIGEVIPKIKERSGSLLDVISSGQFNPAHSAKDLYHRIGKLNLRNNPTHRNMLTNQEKTYKESNTPMQNVTAWIEWELKYNKQIPRKSERETYLRKLQGR